MRHDTCSCSEFARRAVLRVGVVGLAVLLPKRFMRCREAFVALSEGEQQPKGNEDECSAVADVATTAACALFEIASCL